MFVPGEQVRGLFSSVAENYLICAPFIKQGALSALLKCIPQSGNATIDIYTRWSPPEVAAGVSDLEVFEICAARTNVNLYLVDGLHAKLFASGQVCLVGSANVTDRALGWIYPSNIELLIRAEITDPPIAELIQRLRRFSEIATAEKRAAIAAAAASLESIELPESLEVEGSERQTHRWLPNCKKPELIFRLYSLGNLEGELSSIAAAANLDLRFLNPPAGLDHDGFKKHVKEQLRSIALFEELIRLVNRDELVNGVGRRLIQSMDENDMNELDLDNYWSSTRNWLMHFFNFRAEPSEYRIIAGARDS